MIHTRRYVNRAKYAPRITDSLKPLDVVELLKKEIDCNDLPKEDEMVRILEWIGKEGRR